MLRAAAPALAALALTACGGGEEMRSAPNALFACGSAAVRVDFDPTAGVTVSSGGAELASATFTERRVSEDCEIVPNAPRTTPQRSPYDDGSLGEGVYRRAELECSIAGGVRIDLHPIFNADIGRNDGSVLLLVGGRKIVMSAVLKDRGNPHASRVYHAPRYCAAA